MFPTSEQSEGGVPWWLAVFPQAPNVDGLPVWLQIVVSLVFVVATAAAALVGYRKRLYREPPGAAATLVAAFPDMTAVRQLTEQCRILSGDIERLDASTRDQTHYVRDKIEVDRELCMRLRELKEEIVRSDRQRAHRGGVPHTPPV